MTAAWWLLQHLATVAILGGVVAAVCRVARLRPSVAHVLWTVLLIKLMLPPLVHWPWAAPISWRPTAAQPARIDSNRLTSSAVPALPSASPEPGEWDAHAEPNALPEVGPPPWAWNGLPPVIVEFPPPMADPHPHQPGPAVDSVTAAVAWSDPMRILAAIWTAGALVFLGREAVRTLSLIRRIRQSVPAPEWLAALVEDTAARLGVESPRVRVSDRAMTPFVCAIPRAYLVWPAALSSGADAFAWRGVIAHELAHLKRRDPWLAWLSSFAACVWWWNPLARWIRTRLNESAEESCDAWAVSVFPDGAREFALALIRVCELVSTNRTPAPALGAGTGARRPLERRIVMILTQSIPCNRSWFGLALAGLLAAVALPAWLLGQDDPATGPASAAGSASATSDPSSEPPVSGTAPVAQGPSVPAPVSVTALPPGSTGPGVSRLDGIQSQLESLLAEIRSLRSGGTAAAAPAPSVRARVYGSDGFVVSQAGSIAPNNRSSYAVYAGTPGTDEQVLIRRTYDLPQGKADALSALLQESLPNDVETKVDGDRFTVTTTAGRQQVVADFVAMLKGENVELAVRATPYGQYPATIAPRAGSQGTTSAGGVAAPSAR